jgi:hypothetical protein
MEWVGCGWDVDEWMDGWMDGWMDRWPTHLKLVGVGAEDRPLQQRMVSLAVVDVDSGVSRHLTSAQVHVVV